MKTIHTVLTDFQQYVRWPQYVQPLQEAPGSRITVTATLFLAEYPLFLIISALSIGLLVLTSHLTGQDILRVLNRSSQYPLTVFIVSGLLAPVVSEAIFRAILRLTPGRLANTVALLLLLLMSSLYHDIKAATNQYALLWLLPAWGLVAWPVGQYLKRPAVFARIESFWKTHFRWVFYGLALVYALFRVGNIVSLTDVAVLWLPILLAAGLLIGFYLSYVRMKYGFWFAVTVHALMMSLPVGLEVIRLL